MSIVLPSATFNLRSSGGYPTEPYRLPAERHNPVGLNSLTLSPKSVIKKSNDKQIKFTQIDEDSMDDHSINIKAQQTLNHALNFAEAWLQKYSQSNFLKNLPEGEGFNLSRMDVKHLHEIGKLPADLKALYETSVFDRSVVIMKVGIDRFELMAKRHRHVLGNKETLSDMERFGLPKIFNDEGGVNRLVCLDGKKEMQALVRQPKYYSKEATIKAVKQQKTEDALKGIPCIFNRMASGKPLPASHILPGVKPLKGSVYRKMYSDGKKYFGFNPLTLRLNHPIAKHKALKALYQVALGLVQMHNKDIAWRDLKLDNLLIDEDGNVFLSDFDTCDHLNDPTMISKTKYNDNHQAVIEYVNELNELKIEGTPQLMAPWISAFISGEVKYPAFKIASEAKKALQACPEQDIETRKNIVRPLLMKSDSYSFALLAYLLMTGKYPDYIYHNLKFGHGVYTATAKNNRDSDCKMHLTYNENDKPAPNIPNTDEICKNAGSIKAELQQAIIADYPKEFVELVWKGLSPDPTEVPSSSEFMNVLALLL